MRDSAQKDYNVPQKRHWRRTIWNTILKHTGGREQHECILYLAGPHDDDRAIAISKGVPARNLIAIDRDAMNITNVRRQHGIGICDTLQNVLSWWPEHQKVCAVLLDLPSGLEYDVLKCLYVLHRDVFMDAIIMVNLMKGRDRWSNDLRAELRYLCPSELDEKNRAKLAIVAWLLITLFPGGERSFTEAHLHDQSTKSIMTKLFNHIVLNTYEYRSGQLVFNSVVCHTPLHGLDCIGRSSVDGHDSEEFRAHMCVAFDDPHDHVKSTTQRKLAALFAVRTKRYGKLLNTTMVTT